MAARGGSDCDHGRRGQRVDGGLCQAGGRRVAQTKVSRARLSYRRCETGGRAVAPDDGLTVAHLVEW
jgi:hypothetical protein